MMANTISFVLAVSLGYALLRRRIGLLGLTATVRRSARLAAAAAIAAVPTWLLVVVLSARPRHRQGRLGDHAGRRRRSC